MKHPTAVWSTVLFLGFACASTNAADRVVLIQADWENTPPHYATIAGGRGPDHYRILIREGRHPPADEWLMHELRPNVFSFRSLDPFYPDHSLDFTGRNVEFDFSLTADPAVATRGQSPHGDDNWLVRQVAPQLFTFQAAGKNNLHKDLFLNHVVTQSLNYKGIVVRPFDPQYQSNTRFRLIDIRPTRPPDRSTFGPN